MELLHFKAFLILLLLIAGAALAWYLKKKRPFQSGHQRMRIEQQLHTHSTSCLLVSIDGAGYLIATSKAGVAIIKHDLPLSEAPPPLPPRLPIATEAAND